MSEDAVGQVNTEGMPHSFAVFAVVLSDMLGSRILGLKHLDLQQHDFDACSQYQHGFWSQQTVKH